MSHSRACSLEVLQTKLSRQKRETIYCRLQTIVYVKSSLMGRRAPQEGEQRAQSRKEIYVNSVPRQLLGHKIFGDSPYRFKIQYLSRLSSHISGQSPSLCQETNTKML